MEEMQSENEEFQQRNSFKYGRMSNVGMLYKIKDFVEDHKIGVTFGVVFILLFTSYILHFKELSALGELGEIDFDHSSWDSDYELDEDDLDIRITRSFLTQLNEMCELFWCSNEHEKCVCISHDYQDYTNANFTCNDIGGHLFRAKNEEEFNLIQHAFYHSSGNRQFWIGLYKEEGGSLTWDGCTDCLDVEGSILGKAIQSNDLPGENCLALIRGRLMHSPCTVSDLSHGIRKRLDLTDRLGKDDPYWFNRPAFEGMYGYAALMECDSYEAAANIMSPPMGPSGSPARFYAVTNEKFFRKEDAIKNTTRFQSCQLVSLTNKEEEDTIMSYGSLKQKQLWTGAGRTVSSDEASLLWKWIDSSSYQPTSIAGRDLPGAEQCYSMGLFRLAVGRWWRNNVIHPRSCATNIKFTCEIPLAEVKTSSEEEGVTMRLMNYLEHTCGSFACPSEVQGVCYCVKNDRLDWTTASFTCAVNNMTMAAIDSDELSMFMNKQYFQLFRESWVGAILTKPNTLQWQHTDLMRGYPPATIDGLYLADQTPKAGSGCVVFKGYSDDMKQKFGFENCNSMFSTLCEANIGQLQAYLEEKKDDEFDYY